MDNLSERQRLNLSFWNLLQQVAEASAAGATISAQPERWVKIPLRGSGCEFFLVNDPRDDTAGLYLNAKAKYERLKARESELKRRLRGVTFIDTKRQLMVQRRANLETRSAWPALLAWYTNKIALWLRCLKPLIV